MPDVLIRDVLREDLVVLDEQAKRAGLTRSEYLRRRLNAEARRTVGPVTSADLIAFTGWSVTSPMPTSCVMPGHDELAHRQVGGPARGQGLTSLPA